MSSLLWIYAFFWKFIYFHFLVLKCLNDHFSNEYREMSNRLSVDDGEAEDDFKGLDHPSFTSEERINNVTVIKMDIRDPDVTKTGTLEPFLLYFSVS